MKTYDVGIIGTGAMGGAAAYQLAKSGNSVIAFDRHSVPHAFGSSHSESRLIRQAYFENPDYVPLLRRAYRLWEELEDFPGQLFVKNGLFIAGQLNRKVMQGVLSSAKLHSIDIETLSANEARSRFEGFRFDDDELCVFEKEAGYLLVDKCLETHIKKAMGFGAIFKENSEIIEFSRISCGFEIVTSDGTYQTKKLIVATGAWTGSLNSLGKLLPASFQKKLVPHRVPLFWFPRSPNSTVTESCFAFDLTEGFFYGFPQLSDHGVKMGLHKPGQIITDPSNFDRNLKDDERTPVLDFVKKKLTYIEPRITKEATCIYTMSPDEDFIVHEDNGLIVLAGFSGHGFKFASVIGEVAKDLAVFGKTPHPVDFLRYRW